MGENLQSVTISGSYRKFPEVLANTIEAFQRVVSEQTGLECVVDRDICSFDELPGGGYYDATKARRVFVDKVVRVQRKIVVLDDRAEEYIWIPPDKALRDLNNNIEPNAIQTIKQYDKMCA